jgi:hypothetical protein
MVLQITTGNMVNFLKSHQSFIKYHNTMLPKELSVQKIVSALSFISPQIIILHGSFVSKVRYSAKEKQDLDIIVVSIKIPFWLKEILYQEIKNKLFQLSTSVKFDVSLVTPRGLFAHITGKTSLGQSILQGFTILYPGEKYERE